MKTKIFAITLVSFFSFFSCTQDDTDKICASDCTTIIGKIIRADNTGIEGVKVTFSYIISTPHYHTRNIASGYTDQNGNYTMSGYINENEIDISKEFKITIDTLKVQSSLNNEFLKTNEIQKDILTRTANIVIEGFPTRPEIINIVDYIVPFKTELTINLHNFEPVIDYDLFGFESKVEYGFKNQFALTMSENANSTESQYHVITGRGENIIKVRKIKNGQFTDFTENVILTGTPSNVSLDFEY